MLKSKKTRTISVLLFLLFNINSFSQTDNGSLRNNALKIYLDCERCDIDYMKREISFVNYVRDTKEAQVHIMITRQNAGNGGKKYDILFLGQKDFKNQNDTLSFVSMADNTEDEIRGKQLRFIKLGLIKYVSHTKLAELLEINYTKNDDTKSELVKDKWDNWIFNVRANSWFRGESSYSNLYFLSSISAERVTPDWKIIFEAGSNYSKNKYIIGEDATLITEKKSLKGGAVVVKSLNEHWSAGGMFDVGSSLYSNYNLYTTIYPAIEYNIFPYSNSSVKQLTIRLGAGYKYADYIDTTIYLKSYEHLGLSKLALAYKITKKWGSINTSVTAKSFLHDLRKYNIDAQTDLRIRIIKGLSFNLSGGGSLIRNQLNLRKEETSYEDLLLKQKEIASNYSYWMSAGLSYTFGSIYNNVVNPRFDN